MKAAMSWITPHRPSFCAVLLLATLACTASARAQDAVPASGPAIVLDASHLAVADRRFKLYGIDAPDVDETCENAKRKEYPCGVEAREALVKLVTRQEITCRPRGPNQINEMLATCTLGQTDLAGAMIDAGWAIADRARTLYYEKAEEKARTTKHGLWQGPFVPPANWRAGERVPQSRASGPENIVPQLSK